MSETRSGPHRQSRPGPTSPSLLSRMLAVLAVLGTVLALSLAGSSSALAETGGSGYKGVFLSEVFTHGAGTEDDEVAHGDWIELFNSTGEEVNVSGMILSDEDDSHELVIPAETRIPAESYMAFRTDAASKKGAENFGLGDKDEARLYEPGSTVGVDTPADEFDWGHSPVYSWARDFADAHEPSEAEWEASAAVTQDMANDFTPAHTGALTNVVINEVNMNGGENGDWIELYNKDPETEDEPVKLTGAILSDDDDTHAYVIGDQEGDKAELAPGEFAAYRVDDPEVNGNFGLGGNDAARLFTAENLDLYGNGTDPGVVEQPKRGEGAPTVDSLFWATAPAFTLGRVPDGEGEVNDDEAFKETTGATFEASNGTGTPPTHHNLSGVVINEIKTTGDPEHGDWIELLNTNPEGSEEINLSQAILSDDNPNHAIRIDEGTMLAPGETLTITTDTDTDNPALTDPNATGDFGLGDSDSARLFVADATDLAPGGTGVNAPVDSFSWTEHAPTSWGRIAGTTTTNTQSPSVWAQTDNPTYNEANNDFTEPTEHSVDDIQINEISTTDNPGDPIPDDDWVELINTAPVEIDVEGIVLSDSSDAHAITLDAGNTEVGNACTAPGTMGTVIKPGDFALVLVDSEGVEGNFGLGSDDAIRLYAPGATPGTSIPIDHDEWTDHPTGSYQRTDDGLGDWVDGAINTQTPLEPNTGC